MLDRHDVDAELVAQEMFVEALLEQIRGDFRIAIFVREAGAHRRGAVEHFLPAVRAGADAVLAASVFHFGQLRIGDVKRSLREAQLEVR